MPGEFYFSPLVARSICLCNCPFCFLKTRQVFYVVLNWCQNGNCHFMKLPSVFKRVGRACAREKHSFRQQGQGRLSGSIGYLLSHLEATTMNILVHNKAIAVWIASSYCTSSFRDKGLLNIYNFLPVHLSTRLQTDKGHAPVCSHVCVIDFVLCVCVSILLYPFLWTCVYAYILENYM